MSEKEMMGNTVGVSKTVAKTDKDRMRNLVEMSKLITESDSFYNIKDLLVEKMLGMVRPSKACVNLFYGNDYRYSHLVCSDTLKFVQMMYPQNEEHGTKFDFKRCPQYIHEAVKEQKIVIVENLFEDERAEGEALMAMQEGYVGRIVIPFVVHGDTIGFLTCCLTEEDELTQDDIDYLSQVASLMSLSITITEKNKGIKGIIEKLRSSMEGITNATRQALNSEDLKTYLHKMTQVLMEITGSKYSSINLYGLDKGDNKREHKISIDSSSLEGRTLENLKAKVLNGDRLMDFEKGEFELDNGEKVQNLIYYTHLIGEDEELVVICADSNKYTIDDYNTLAIVSKQITTSIKGYIHNKKKKEHKEIASGFSVLKDQQRLIMSSANSLEAFSDNEIFFYHETSKIVGGDFYNAVEKDDKVLFIISDIMGHGIVSNYTVALIKGAFDILSQSESTPADILKKLNDNLYEEFDKMGMFATGLVGVFDKNNGVLSLSNAGHYFPIFIDEDGNITSTQEGVRDIPIGILPNRNYQNVEYDLSSMREVVLFTDGILEAKNPDGKEFGIERFCEFLLETKDLEKDEILTRLKEEIENFTNGREIYDDMLAVFMKRY